MEQLSSGDCTTEKRLLLACTQGWGAAPQWVVFVKAAIKEKRGLLRKLAGLRPWPLAMLSLDGRAPLILLLSQESWGSGACTGVLQTLGWWVMVRASQGSGGHSFIFEVTTANAGVVLTGWSSDPHTPRVGTAEFSVHR